MLYWRKIGSTSHIFEGSRKAISEEVTVEPRSELRKGLMDRGLSRCKGSEVGKCLVNLRIREASMCGVERVRGREL